jgi:arginyl-tRNA synthetase
MNIFETYRNHVLAAAEAVLPGLKTDAVTLEPPRDPSHGDLSTNAAMVLAGQAKQKPRDIAEKIAEKLRAVEAVESVEIAGPGFINIRLSAAAWQHIIPVILQRGIAFGDSHIGQNKAINVEYVSANPTGPLHIGHARGAVYGDALATLLVKAGYNVTREYYINDAGAQVAVLAESALLRYREACGEDIGEIPAGLYPGEYLKGVGVALKEIYGEELLSKPKAEQIEIARDIAIECMMGLIKADLGDMGIFHDVFTSEAALRDKIPVAIQHLQDKGYVYRGVLEPPKGEKVEDWEPVEQLLFRAEKFGDDMDRTVQKANGAYTYFAGDFALTMDKISRGFSTLIYMLGADHGGYIKRLTAITRAFSDEKVECDVRICQLVHLFKNGEPVRMSKRAGNFVTVRDVLDEVGKDILRFVMLMRKTNQDMEFDLDKVKEQSRDNPVFYVQYAHARAKSVLRLAATQMPEAFAASENVQTVDMALLSHPAELTLIKLLAGWPRLVEQAAVAHEPHRIIYYLQELAAAFHGLWNAGSKENDIRFVQEGSPALTAARLALARATTVVVASGLAVCGVSPADELR